MASCKASTCIRLLTRKKKQRKEYSEDATKARKNMFKATDAVFFKKILILRVLKQGNVISSLCTQR